MTPPDRPSSAKIFSAQKSFDYIRLHIYINTQKHWNIENIETLKTNVNKQHIEWYVVEFKSVLFFFLKKKEETGSKKAASIAVCQSIWVRLIQKFLQMIKIYDHCEQMSKLWYLEMCFLSSLSCCSRTECRHLWDNKPVGRKNRDEDNAQEENALKWLNMAVIFILYVRWFLLPDKHLHIELLENALLIGIKMCAYALFV